MRREFLVPALFAAATLKPLLSRGALDRSQNTRLDIFDPGFTFDLNQQMPLPIELHQRCGLRQVHFNPASMRLWRIIRPLVELATAHVALACDPRGLVRQVVHRLALGAGPAAGQPLQQHLSLIHI